MVKLKRIKTKEDLIDVLNFIWEDVNTYKFMKNHNDISNELSGIIKTVESGQED